MPAEKLPRRILCSDEFMLVCRLQAAAEFDLLIFMFNKLSREPRKIHLKKFQFIFNYLKKIFETDILNKIEVIAVDICIEGKLYFVFYSTIINFDELSYSIIC